MSTWKTPSVVEVPVGLEIGAYAPAELDAPPRAVVARGEATAAQGDGALGREATPRRRSPLS
jgi:coenzyme PQQ precursor peptide PqqA